MLIINNKTTAWEHDGDVSFQGLDIGPFSKRKLYDMWTKPQRFVIKVQGHQAWSGIGMTTYYHPHFYLVKNGHLVCTIEYDKHSMKEARLLARQFIDRGEIPEERRG